MLVISVRSVDRPLPSRDHSGDAYVNPVAESDTKRRRRETMKTGANDVTILSVSVRLL